MNPSKTNQKIIAFFGLLVICLLIISATPVEKKPQKIKAPKNFALIPEGSLKYSSRNNVPGNLEYLKNIAHINEYYLQKTETTNAQYKEFLNDLLKQGKTKDFEIAKIKKEYWKDYNLSGYENYENLNDYPVVNISKEGAELYCKWLQNKMNNDNKNKLAYEYEVRLPTFIEWLYAARNGDKTIIFPWEGPYAHNAKGAYLAQFRAIGLPIGPVKVTSFYPNKLGLYTMAGNVAEMVADSNVTLGGSWNSWEVYIQLWDTEPCKICPTMGFRPLLNIKKNE
jgi:formylglycine-generating enzyme required for sulfatase activity